MPETTPVRLAVFDCDGTLVDSQYSIVAAMRTACAVHGLAEPSAESVRRVVGLHLFESIQTLLPAIGEESLLRIQASYIDAYRDLRARGEVRDPLFPGATAAIKAIEKAGWLMGVATGKSYRGLMATLERHNMTQSFVTLQTADSAAGKPHPEMLRNAMNETGAEPAGTVMIGDTTYDMGMARNAGTRAIGVAWGYHAAAELLAAGADRIVSGFEELPAALFALSNGAR